MMIKIIIIIIIIITIIINIKMMMIFKTFINKFLDLIIATP